ncbi:MAG: IS66 family insertion sequence element accessory protein TnpB [Pseudohongiellaceae bacterium]
MTTQEHQQYWQQQIGACQAAGLSGAAYCKQHDLSYHKFVYWRRKLSKHEGIKKSAAVPVGFAKVMSQPLATGLTLSLPGGLSVSGFHAGNIELLGTVLKQL